MAQLMQQRNGLFILSLGVLLIATLPLLLKNIHPEVKNKFYNLVRQTGLDSLHLISYSLKISLTFSLNFWQIIIFTVLLVYGSIRLIKYLQSRYSRLKEVKRLEQNITFGLRPPSKTILREDKNKEEDFLTAFFSSIKVFGYLESEVFQELNKHIQQITIKKGENVVDSATENKAFYAVIEGCVRIYADRNQNNFEEIFNEDYYLLNEVRAGESITSLFNILHLLTEKQMPMFSIGPSSNASYVNNNTQHAISPGLIKVLMSNNSPFKSLNIVAKANTDVKLLVIPEEAFLSLSDKYPTAAAHIIQVIMARLQRVTFTALHKYLGLNQELIKLERSLKNSVVVKLDDSLRDCALNEFQLPSSKPHPVLSSSHLLALKHSVEMKPSTSIVSNSFIEIMSTSSQERSLEIKTDIFKAIISALTGNHEHLSPLNLDQSPPSRRNSSTSSTSGKEGLSIFDRNIEIIYAPKGSILVKQGQRDGGLLYVLEGILEVSIDNESKSITLPKEKCLFKVKNGYLAGLLSSLTGHPSIATIKSLTDSYIFRVKREFLERYIESHHEITISLAKRLIHNLSPLVRHVDVALDWRNLSSGKVLYNQGDESDSIYIVLHGRLRATRESRNGFEVVSEYGQGDSFGEMEVLSGTKRLHTIHAIRNTELIRIPKTLFNALSLRYPETTIQVSKTLASNSRQLADNNFNVNKNIKTIGILPVNDRVPIKDFADNLKFSLDTMSNCKLIDTTAVINALGRHIFSSIGKLKLTNWLMEYEESNDIILLLADGVNSPWTQQCILQADCILLVAIAKDDPNEIGEYEELLLEAKTTARKEMIFLHSSRSMNPGTTQSWLQSRLWINHHQHIFIPGLKTRRNSLSSPVDNIGFETILKSYYEEFKTKRRNSDSMRRDEFLLDFYRLGRRLLGKSIGLVLGGGGARGLSHVGVIKAFEEYGIPIDVVGGTSIGSFVGALYARETDSVAIYGRAKFFSNRMATTWRFILDLTYPFVSWFTGHGFNRSIWKVFYDTHIEDLWLDYFCVTTDVSHSKMCIHRSGYVWRFVRASMSLSGFLPPLCDRGSMLVDGGYVNILPVDVMKNTMGADIIFAVDVASDQVQFPANHGDSVSGWGILLKKLMFAKPGIPSLTEIQSRLAFVSSNTRLQKAKETEGCFYMKPPVGRFTTLQFGAYEEIVKVGYDYAKKKLAEWEASGELEKLISIQNYNRARRNSV
ncbi:RmlC-like jelly roll fold domain-containing protein [Rozella allomycis CSF55]|uniref:Lysophospholipase NTE1 n=1 Tax=Rozella allomycis (strain CSF55) TaxID=988480 RepID=A0A075ARH2_ROZAC|nr:RmlC-like jelly roll fold domain-containing protein [Rozella allomycis CSF55]|eukprot:EPZ31326.1 RmlC-like jelly roll fold domain-containing protein [Rozella allomycis CSF55]